MRPRISSTIQWSLLCLVLLIATMASAADAPSGKFQCRRYPAPQGYAEPVAYLWIHPNGTYDLLDLTTTRGKTSGRYSYDRKKQQIDWTTGDWTNFIGRYYPRIEGVPVITVNTKKDPEGHVDGTLPCVRVSEKTP
jgi:hypothetical protein